MAALPAAPPDAEAVTPTRRFAPGFTADVSWLSAGYLVRSLAYLGTAAFLARALGPAGFGHVSLFMALAAAIGYLAGSWPFVTLPVMAAEGHSIRSILVPASKVAALAALACAAVALPLGAVLISADAGEIALLALYAAGLIGLQALYAAFQAHGRMPAIGVAQASERLLTLAVLGLLAVAAGASIRQAEIALAGGAVVVCAAGFLLPSGPDLGSGGRRVTMRDVLAAAGAMAVVTACSYLVAWIDILVLGAFKSDHEVGIYALAYQLFAFVVQLAALSIVAALPRHARRAASGSSDAGDFVPVGRLLDSTRVWAAGVAFAGAVGVALAPLAFGSDFERSAAPLALLLAAAAILAPYYALVPVAVALRKTRILAGLSIGAAAVNLALDVALVPVVGLWGAVIATVAQSLVASVALTGLTLGWNESLRLTRAAVPAALLLAGLAAAGRSTPVLVAALALGALLLGVSLVRARSLLRDLRPS